MTTRQQRCRWSLSILLWLGLLAGCCGIPASYQPVAEFRRKHPKECERYAYLNPISLETYVIIWGERAGAYSYILEEAKRLFGETEGVKQFVESMAEREGKDRRLILEFFGDLESTSSGGGAVCQYEWSDGKTREVGFLVLKAGDVIKREPWITDYPVERNE